MAPAARQTLPRPSDFSQLGRGVSSSGSAAPPTFGSKSVFSRGKGKAPGTATPPQISRQTSTTNMFSALDVGEATDEPQRKKLALQPRTKPTEDEEEDEITTPPMGEEGAKAKINRDMKELWGEKDTGGSRNPDDVVEYYRTLPEEHRSLLTQRLIDDGFRIAKMKEFEVIAKGWAQVREEALVDKEALIDGWVSILCPMLTNSIKSRMSGLDDEAIDFPQAYQAVGI